MTGSHPGDERSYPQRLLLPFERFLRGAVAVEAVDMLKEKLSTFTRRGK
jgi:hypothetical protein